MTPISHCREHPGMNFAAEPGSGRCCIGTPVLVHCAALLASLLIPPLFGAEMPIQLDIERVNGSPWVTEVRFALTPGTVYRLVESSDLVTWKAGRTRVAREGNVKVAVTNGGTARAFYRLELIQIRPVESMVWIEPGTFVMGSPMDEVGRFLDKEEPQTNVTLTRGYWICRYEVRQEEYQALIGSNPSLFKGDLQRPVENVTWFNAVDYCTKLTARERQAGNLPEGFVYRLPTEAEWEYAARAGTTTRFSYGDDADYRELGKYAWYSGNSGLKTHPIGQKLPNPWGIYDLHGNVFEWGMDWFGQLPGGAVVDPVGPDIATDRIIRGGYWDSVPAFCRSAMRVHFPPSFKISYLGFRVVLAETTTEKTTN